MAEYAPREIRALFDAVKARIPQAELSGILGDPRTHLNGYHRARAWIMAEGEGLDDYSVTQPDDKVGPAWAASALDITLPQHLMITVTKRLIKATERRDPRLKCLREFLGTLDGKTVTGRDVATRKAITSYDLTHTWHVHLSIRRRYAEDAKALLALVGVITGEDDEVTKDDIKAIVTAVVAGVWNADVVNAVPPPDNNDDYPQNDHWTAKYGLHVAARGGRSATRLAQSADAKADQALADTKAIRDELVAIRALLESRPA